MILSHPYYKKVLRKNKLYKNNNNVEIYKFKNEYEKEENIYFDNLNII